ncbi:MAG: parvulin peptidyl-prolyl isomerase [Ignavibacteria bacterium CG22_combo_CG10-13_8_21_14_all_37_15]|nr:parvulin peptidyl-prolyl isomerase [Ignavibacteria bacterium]NCS81914.1 parvulin peptidyl-prolyl isomerase [Ignavibacteria bacterium]PIP78912.1 MAG: parvulin peptidyl-prolyl isomerase [Ignavibacteria bacterium CG22_combo_CG10-13_8_21_14_all_37_15]PIS43929.1 MAG: parvulin peptidyl-prolyl isomerase [Ignavibacteria bacterium CG08_land_8_20_14_0_20_37_9]PJC60338.1 MAG: parvulin peptidyl-prolyl isomerase [Ignavibacteria bacterium CG_4_9_14_0_2_um_filter_37_13]
MILILKNRTTMTKYFLFLLLFILPEIFAQQSIDKVIAVVDNEIILKSELEYQINLLAAQRKVDPQTPALREQVLKMLIDEKLVYAQAGLDSISVSEEEIAKQIDYQISQLLQQYGSKERVEQMYNMNIEKIKRELRDDVRKNIMIQKTQEKKFGQVESTRREVEDFFAQFKDSLGVIPEKVKISHIFKNPQTSSKLKDKYRAEAQAILDSIKGGSSFEELAKKYSEDPGSAVQGGDLGFVKRGVFYPEFESAAYALKEKQLSEVIESPVGFHIIQLLEKRGESIHTRHILIKIKADDESDLNTIEMLTEIRDSIVRKFGTFYEFAKKYSDDKETVNLGGQLGSFYLNQLDKTLLEIVGKLKDGEISYPKRVNYAADSYGYHIVWLEKKILQHKPNIDVDYTELKKLSDEYKKQKLYAQWLEELKTKIFWEIKE